MVLDQKPPLQREQVAGSSQQIFRGYLSPFGVFEI